MAGEGHLSTLAETFGARGIIHNVHLGTKAHDVTLADNLQPEAVTMQFTLLAHDGHYDLLYV